MDATLVEALIVFSIITLSLSVHIPADYPFTIESEPATFEGRVCSDAIVNQPVVRMSEEAEPTDDGCSLPNEHFIKLLVRNVTANIVYNGHRRMDGHLMNVTRVIPHRRNTTNDDLVLLPDGLEFDVFHTDAFEVDNDFLIVVNHRQRFKEQKSIQFYVALVALPKRKIVSNPLPFVVHVDHRHVNGHNGAVIFAGVIALLIIGIVLTIPLTVFIKRRRRKGKPICMCGKAPEKEVEAKPEAPVQNGGLKGSINPSMIFNTELGLKESPSEASLSKGFETIQDHQLRSLSNMHFEQTWLDPHYRDSQHLKLQKSKSNGSHHSVNEKF